MYTQRVCIKAWMCGTVVIVSRGYDRHNRAQQELGQVKKYLSRFGVSNVWVGNDNREDTTWLEYLWLKQTIWNCTGEII